MTDFALDPMGLKLMTWNKPKAPKAKPKAAAPAPALTPAPTFVIQPYMMPSYHCYNNYYPQNFCSMPMFVQNVHSHYAVLPPAPEPVKEAKPQHVCVNCNDKNKCKACKKIVEAKKKYICKPTFFNPRVTKK